MAPTPGINAGASLLAAPEAGAWHHLGITAPAHQLVMLVEDRRRVRAELRTVRVVNPPLVEPGRPQAPPDHICRLVVGPHRSSPTTAGFTAIETGGASPGADHRRS